MTWVCAVSSVYGYGALYSDVQVEFKPGGETEDLIQKAHPVSNSIAAGFSGSVCIGFELLGSLQDYLNAPGRKSDPISSSQSWVPVAKSIFAHAPPVERNVGGTAILMVGVLPSERPGPGSTTYFVRFSAPDFRPHISRRAQNTWSIGRGARVKEYKRSVKQVTRRTSGLMQAEVMNPGGWARAFGFAISHALARHPTPGISRHLHYVIVRQAGIVVETNDENIYPPDDGPRIEIRMPSVAANYKEFLALARSSGHQAHGASC